MKRRSKTVILDAFFVLFNWSNSVFVAWTLAEEIVKEMLIEEMLEKRLLKRPREAGVDIFKKILAEEMFEKRLSKRPREAGVSICKKMLAEDMFEKSLFDEKKRGSGLKICRHLFLCFFLFLYLFSNACE